MASSLKKFLKALPTREDIDKALAEITTDGPRGAIIIGATLLEDALRVVIRRHMISLKKEEADQLFTGTAPLATFSAKIRLAYALGLIGPKTRGDLDNVRELRNAFAHGKMVLRFETPEVAEVINTLNCLTTLDKGEFTPRLLYRAAIRILLLHLTSKLDEGLAIEIGPEVAGLG
jgi:DNA-binding MltR family transcriptional regulator